MSGDLHPRPLDWWLEDGCRPKDADGSPAGPHPLDQRAPSLATQSIAWAGKWMLGRVSGKSLEKSFSAPLSQGVSQLWCPSQGQPHRRVQPALQERTGSSHSGQHSGKAKDKALSPKCDKALITKHAAPWAGVFLPKLTRHFMSMWLSAGDERLLSAGGRSPLSVKNADFLPVGPASIPLSWGLQAGTACVPETFPPLGCCPQRGVCL